MKHHVDQLVDDYEKFQKEFVGPRLSIFKMTPDERQRIMQANSPIISGIHFADVYFDWGWIGCGFGQLGFRLVKDTGKIHCMNECMSRERVKIILHSFIDSICDNMILDNE